MNTEKKPILFVGRIIESKGLKTLINSYYNVTKEMPNCNPLWIIGGNDLEVKHMKEQPEIADAIDNLSLTNQIFWWGHLPHNILPYLIRKCLFSCFPSKYEPGGRTILEAMACGIPVIASPFGFAEEVVITGQTGLLIEKGTEEEWSNKIAYLILNPLLAEEMGRNAKQVIKEKFNMNIFQQKHLDIYHQFHK